MWSIECWQELHVDTVLRTTVAWTLKYLYVKATKSEAQK